MSSWWKEPVKGESRPLAGEPVLSLGWEEKAAGTALESQLHLPYHSSEQLIHTPPLSKAESLSPRKEILKSVQTSLP